jgi:hypothetical protein
VADCGVTLLDPFRYVTRSAVGNVDDHDGVSFVRGRPWREDGYGPFLRWAVTQWYGSMRRDFPKGAEVHRVGTNRAAERACDLYVH